MLQNLVLIAPTQIKKKEREGNSSDIGQDMDGNI